MPRTVTLLTTSTVTTTDANFGNPSAVVGSPPQWSDDSDASYVSMSGVYQGEIALTGDGTASLTPGIDVGTNAELTTVRARLRVSSDSGRPIPRVTIFKQDNTPMLTGGDGPSGIVSPGAPTWVDVPLDDAIADGKDIFLDWLTNNRGSLHLTVAAPLSFTFPGVITSYTWLVYEVQVIVTVPGGIAPPCRLTGRGDFHDFGGGRLYPFAKTQQGGFRTSGTY